MYDRVASLDRYNKAKVGRIAAGLPALPRQAGPGASSGRKADCFGCGVIGHGIAGGSYCS